MTSKLGETCPEWPKLLVCTVKRLTDRDVGNKGFVESDFILSGVSLLNVDGVEGTLEMSGSINTARLITELPMNNIILGCRRPLQENY